MEFPQESGAGAQQEQQRRFTAYFDLLPGITRQFGEVMASNRQAKINSAIVESLHLSPEEDAGNVAGPAALCDDMICTDEAA
jgi:16S rRNA G527 N7-methylase RsmG